MIRERILQVCFVGFSLLAPAVLTAQNYTNHWYFGTSNNLSLRFARGTNDAALVTTPHGTFAGNGGSAVVSSPVNGDLLFYTNGTSVFDITHTPMPGGSLAADVNDNQPVVAGRVPGQQSKYFIITRAADGSLSFSVIDMTLQGNAATEPLGDFESANTLFLGAVARSEAMITVPHANGTDFWVITHEDFGGLPQYTATQFNSLGPVSPAQSTINVGQILSAGNFAYNARTNQIVVSPNEPLRDVEVLGFDNTTGAFSLVKTLANSAVPNVAGNGIYDAEWSNNDRYIYISQVGADNVPRIMQYNVKDPNNQLILPEEVPISPSTRRSYGLQMAPDSAIYHLYENNLGQFLLGKITDADTVVSVLTYVPEAFPGNNFLARQFPSFLPRTNVNLTVDFTFAGLCAGAPTIFTPNVIPQPDSLVWNIDGADLFGQWSPTPTLDAGTHSVFVTAYLNGEAVASQTKAVVIQDPGVEITLEGQVTACSSELPFPQNHPTVQGCNDLGTPCFTVPATVTGSATLEWFGPEGNLNNQTSTLAPNTSGSYYLVATAPNGCQVHAPVNVKEYRVQDMRANIWYFGTNAGIDFNPMFDVPPGNAENFPNPVMDAPEGTSTISDRNGQVVFFTDGNQVWDRTFTPLAPVGLGGDVNSAQSSLIMPVPGDETLYYIFTTQAIPGTTLFELRYTLFNLRLRNGAGDLVDPDNNPATPPGTVLFTRSTERITGNQNWLIAHEYGNNSFLAYRVSTAGIEGPVISGIGSDHSALSPESGSGYMVLSDESRLAVALPLASSNVIEIFDFVDSTGVVSNFRSVTVPQAAGDVYGVHSAGNRLFATVLGDNSIYEFVYDDVTDTYSSLGPLAATASAQPGAIQAAPGGQIFVALDGMPRLGTINPFTADQTTPSTYDDNGFPLATTPAFPGLTPLSQLGLPNFVQTVGEPPQTPAIAANGFCLHQNTNFTANGYDDTIDIFAWDFGDGSAGIPAGQPGENMQVSYLYPAAGTFNAVVTISNKCEAPYTRNVSVTINSGPDPNESMLADPNNNIICQSQLLTGSFSLGAAATYEWAHIPGPPPEPAAVVATRPGVYSVIVTETATGCSVTKNQLMLRFFQDFDLGNDLGLCEGQQQFADAGIQDPTLTYQWTVTQLAPVPGAPVIVANMVPPHRQLVNTNVPGVFRYRLDVTDAGGTCTTFDEVTYTVSDGPNFTLTPNDPAVCGGQGSIDLAITTPLNTKFRYTVTGPSSVPDISDLLPGAVENIAPLDPGQYFVTVTDQVSRCPITRTASISDPSVTATIVPQAGCDPNLQFQVQTNVVGTYELFDATTGALVDNGNTVAMPATVLTNINKLQGGRSYFAIVRSTGIPPCTAVSPTVPINQSAAYGVTLGSVNCTTNAIVASITAGAPPAATTFDWTTIPAGGIVSENDATGSAVLAPGNWNVTVIASGPGPTCRGTATRPVVVTAPFTANITQDPANGCANSVALNAAPNAADFRFAWRKNAGAFVPGGPQITALLADHGSVYTVNIVNNNSGCASTDDHTAQVLGTIAVNLGSPPISCLGNDLTLTAVPSPVRPGTTFQWFLDNVQIQGQSASTLTTPAQAGIYSVRAVSNGCTSDPDEVAVNPVLPTAVDLGVFKRICPEPQAPLSRRTALIRVQPGNLMNYTWTDPLGAQTSGPSPDFTASVVGVHTVTALNASGCESTAQVEVIRDCDPVITGPNAFRPNSRIIGGPGGDNTNQNFWLFTFFIEPESFQILIFNRWGEMVFESNDPQFKWNGGYNNNINNPVPSGTYSFVVKYRPEDDPDKGVQEQRGGVVLLR